MRVYGQLARWCAVLACAYILYAWTPLTAVGAALGLGPAPETLGSVDGVNSNYADMFGLGPDVSTFKASTPAREDTVVVDRDGDRLPTVKIDSAGKFKFVLVEVTDSTTGAHYQIVRGSARFNFHKENFEAAQQEAAAATKQQQKAASLKVLGGGRLQVNHEANGASIWVYGYSKTFGRCR